MHRIQLPSPCDAEAATSLCAALRAQLDKGPLQIDGTEALRFGQLTLQVLLNARQTIGREVGVIALRAPATDYQPIPGIGATVLGDAATALILDVDTLAHQSGAQVWDDAA